MKKSAVAVFLIAALSASAQTLRWQQVDARDGSFTVSMPGQPKVTTKTLTGKKTGRPVPYTSYMVDLGRNAYLMSTSDYDEETTVSLDNAIDGALSTWTSPAVRSREKTQLYGHEGETVDFTASGFRCSIRVVIVGKRLYQLASVEAVDGFDPAMRERFMSSFRLR